MTSTDILASIDALASSPEIEDAVAAIDPARLCRAAQIAAQIQVEAVLESGEIQDTFEARQLAEQASIDLAAAAMQSDETGQFLQAVACAHLDGRLLRKGPLLTGLFAFVLLSHPAQRLQLRDSLDELLLLDREHFVALAARCAAGAAEDAAWRGRNAALLQGLAFEERTARLARLRLVGGAAERSYGELLLRVMAKACA